MKHTMLINFWMGFLKVSLSILVFISPVSSMTNTQPGSGWYVQISDGTESRLLHPNCFTVEWMSSDNFEEYEEVFNIQREDFRKFPGMSFGREITNYHPIKPSWNKDGFISHETISLIQSVEACAPESFEYAVADDGSVYTVTNLEFGRLEQTYKLLAPISIKKCAELSPNIGANCLKAFRVEVGEYSGGSMGWDVREGIYGLFDLPDLGLSIVPLKLR